MNELELLDDKIFITIEKINNWEVENGKE
jgi:hypothetical protein